MTVAQALPSDAPLIVAALFVAVVAVTVKSSVHTVREGGVEALLVMGEMKAVLGPGLNIVPPFISEAYPVDERTMKVEDGEGGFPVPEEFRDDIREKSC